MKYLSLFSGIGGFELGIKKAYEEMETIDRKKNRGSQNVKTKRFSKRYSKSKEIDSKGRQFSEYIDRSGSRQKSFTCIGFSEIDKYAIQIYEKHFKHKNYGNITKINVQELPNFDLIVGGFPCQSFSIAGKRGGFKDTRGTLFFEIARIVKAKRPHYLLLENVKGLLSHDEGNTFATIISTIDELGYDCQWQVLNSKNFGVPQNRERVFIIGHLRGTSKPKVFPIGESNQKSIRETNKQGCSNTLTGRSAGGQNRRGNYITGGLQAHASTMKNCSTALTEAMGKGGGHTPILNAIRRLTPTECERLQGFPDGWTEGVSDTQRYKCLGNAVTVNVIKEIIKKLL